MSKHRTSHPHQRGSAQGPATSEDELETLDQPTDVLSFGANEHTEIQKDLGAIAAFRQAQAPTSAPSSLYGDEDDRTEVNADLDVNAALALARQRFGSHPSATKPRANPQPTPVKRPSRQPTASSTFDANEKTEFGLDISTLTPQQKPRTRFATTAAQSVKPQPTRRQSGAHPTAQRPSQNRTSGIHAQLQPSSGAASPRSSGVYPQASATASSARVSGAYQDIRAPQPSGAYTSLEAPHTSGAYPAASHAQPAARPRVEQSLDEATEPAHDALLHAVATPSTSEPVRAPAPAPSTESFEATAEAPKLGYMDLGLNSPLVAPKVKRQVEFLKEETGVDFDPMAMSSPNLNALVLAMGAQQAELQSTAVALVNDTPDELIALSMKWGSPESPPPAKMRVHYGAWGGFAGFCIGTGLMVTLSFITQKALSAFGAMAVLFIALPMLLGLVSCALKPRRIEALLFKSKLLPSPSNTTS